jgi:uncharacterized protein YndB with AHSA1/START domain
MADRIERELRLEAPPATVWQAITGDGWLADEVQLELHPGGEARFRSAEGVKQGWVEEARAPDRLAFWWARGEEPATRVELRLDEEDGGTRLRIRETRPLEVLDLVGIALPGSAGRSYGPALIAA